MNDRVFCHSSYCYDNWPTALICQGRHYAVERVAAEWRTPTEKCFRVCTPDGSSFDLIYDLFEDEWRIIQQAHGITDPDTRMNRTITGEQNQ